MVLCGSTTHQQWMFCMIRVPPSLSRKTTFHPLDGLLNIDSAHLTDKCPRVFRQDRHPPPSHILNHLYDITEPPNQLSAGMVVFEAVVNHTSKSSPAHGESPQSAMEG
ncbi:unnamed protein product [Pleuronectes platessa]|uniref:Uncharacterized protein n=1 Tax=Pleuronectes platessa TaxID=8262 RepID=A0A9N7YNE8_PLEPL|nr:unnamed protein product [Pleuronectes platessa]